MNLVKLHSLYLAYHYSRSNGDFQSLYDELEDEKRKHTSIMMRSGHRNVSDAIELFDETCWNVAREECGDFGRVFTKALKNARLNFYRKRKRSERWFGVLELDQPVDHGEDGAATPTLLDRKGSSDNVAQKMKEADQRQLIDSFVNDPAKVDPVTTLIVTKFSQYDSVTALAKALGIHHEVVKRKLERVRRQYDANRFGDYREYLAV
ncbi:hypothetical protein [Paenibacillus humicus]|uniref:hypothetical protein n=1 Tax=Paenibacillus humicus TaxID=412861 RepID=UPI000FDAEE7C|nr:hypothetical protein [Paenibacillus humicus]